MNQVTLDSSFSMSRRGRNAREPSDKANLEKGACTLTNLTEHIFFARQLRQRIVSLR